MRRALLELAQDYETSSEEFLQQARLVLATPSVHARSLGHKAEREAVIRAFAAERAGQAETSLLPQLLAPGCMAALGAGPDHVAARRRPDRPCRSCHSGP